MDKEGEYEESEIGQIREAGDWVCCPGSKGFHESKSLKTADELGREKGKTGERRTGKGTVT